MREIRTYELDQSESVTRLFIARPHTLRVCRGLLWVTVEGDAADWWLEAGERMELPAGVTVWVSAHGEKGRFDLVFESMQPFWWRLAERLIAALGRRSVARYL